MIMDMTITDIRPFDRGKGRNAIYLNDEFAFVLYKGELSKYGLEVGVKVSDDLYARIMKETVFIRARKRAMNLLKTIDRTEADVRRKLTEGGYPPEAVDDAIAYIASYHYIDDARYAEDYIRCKSATMSRKQISMKLAEKGVARSVIDAAFSAYDDENGDDGSDAEAQLIRKLVAKRCPQGADSLDYKDRQKLYAYLYGKGFSVAQIEEALKDAQP